MLEKQAKKQAAKEAGALKEGPQTGNGRRPRQEEEEGEEGGPSALLSEGLNERQEEEASRWFGVGGGGAAGVRDRPPPPCAGARDRADVGDRPCARRRPARGPPAPAYSAFTTPPKPRRRAAARRRAGPARDHIVGCHAAGAGAGAAFAG